MSRSPALERPIETRRRSSRWGMRRMSFSGLQGLHDTGQRALGDAGFGRDVAGLLLTPDPQDPEHREGDPAEVVLGEDRPLHVIAHGRAGAVDVGDGAHRREVEVLSLQARA